MLNMRSPLDGFRSPFGRGAGGAAFDPLTQTPLAWYDPSDLSTMFQDAAGSTPVTTAGQTVKRINDKSGNGYHLSNTGAAWTLENDGTNNYLATDGLTRLQTTATTGDITWGADQAAIFIGIKPNTGGTSKEFLQFGQIASQAQSFQLETLSGGILVYRKASGAFGGRSIPTINTDTVVLSVNLNAAGATHATENPDIRISGVQPSLTNYGTADTGTGNFGTYQLRLGGGVNFFAGRIYQVLLFAANKTGTDLTSIEAYVAAKAGVPPFEYTAVAGYLDSAAVVDETLFLRGSPFSRVKYTTTATNLMVDSYSNIDASFPTYGEVGLYVDGVWSQSLEAPANGAYSTFVTLSAGTKTIEFVCGAQSSPTQSLAAVLGTWPVGIYANAELTLVTDTPTNRILVYGDSIAVGSNATTPPQHAWPVLLRADYAPNSVSVEAFGFRSLYLDANTSGLRAAFIDKIETYSPSILWMAIGTNDYGLNKWAKAEFATAYAAFLDDVHVALPSMLIYCQTPILRTSEGANASFGQTLAEYRAEIATVVGTRTSFCTLVDGTAILTTSDLDDGVHPTTAGQALYATSVAATLGI